MATVEWILGFYRTIINFAVSTKLCPPINIRIPIPKTSEVKNLVTERLSQEELKRFLDALHRQPPQLRNL